MNSLAFGDLLLGDLAHVRRRGANDSKRRGQMNIYHCVPLLVGHVLNDRIPSVAGVVDDDVDAAE